MIDRIEMSLYTQGVIEHVAVKKDCFVKDRIVEAIPLFQDPALVRFVKLLVDGLEAQKVQIQL
jgi:hypothetical protein